MASIVDICNLAIGWLAGNLITDLDDPSVEAILCKANYILARDAVLEDKAWSFAMTRKTLTPILAPTIPVSMRQFLLPADCIRITKASAVPTFDDYLMWQLERGRVLAETTILYIKYIARIEDTAQFSPNFVQALAARMAADMAVPLTESRTMMETMFQVYEVKLSNAGNTDGMQGKSEKFRSNQLVDVRQAGSIVR